MASDQAESAGRNVGDSDSDMVWPIMLQRRFAAGALACILHNNAAQRY